MLLLVLGCAGGDAPEPLLDDTALVVDTGDTADRGGDTPAPSSLALGQPPPDFRLVDTNPGSATYEQTVVPAKQLGVVTGWYFFKAS